MTLQELRKYLLENESRIQSFLEKYSDWVRSAEILYIDWINSLPAFRWITLLINDKDKEAVIGLLCYLYDRKKIDVSIDLNANGQVIIQRFPKIDLQTET